jgi:hypothetical protein
MMCVLLEDDALEARSPEIGFIFIGGAHQVMHLAPVALELARRGSVRLRIFAATEPERQALHEFWEAAGQRCPAIEPLAIPSWMKVLAAPLVYGGSGKVAHLLASLRRLREPDLLVVAERTSTLLKRLPGKRPTMVHIPHGAGDRAKGFEKRIGYFDHVLVAGTKDRDRLLAEGVCREGDVTVTGYVKLAGLRQARRERAAPLFDNARPTVLYNPHFDRRLGSWHRYGEELLAAFREQDAFNLVFAPHVRLSQGFGSAQRRRLLALAHTGRIHVDLGSPRCNDMSYTTAADIYLGDVSSQVYEFLAEPRPCVFAATVPADEDDPDFAFHRFGEVAWSPGEVLACVGRARARHAEFVDIQRLAVLAALGPQDGHAAVTAADAIEALAHRTLRNRKGSMPSPSSNAAADRSHEGPAKGNRTFD